jgi:hypothetical protein
MGILLKDVIVGKLGVKKNIVNVMATEWLAISFVSVIIVKTHVEVMLIIY